MPQGDYIDLARKRCVTFSLRFRVPEQDDRVRRRRRPEPRAANALGALRRD